MSCLLLKVGDLPQRHFHISAFTRGFLAGNSYKIVHQGISSRCVYTRGDWLQGLLTLKCGLCTRNRSPLPRTYEGIGGGQPDCVLIGLTFFFLFRSQAHEGTRTILKDCSPRSQHFYFNSWDKSYNRCCQPLIVNEIVSI